MNGAIDTDRTGAQNKMVVWALNRAGEVVSESFTEDESGWTEDHNPDAWVEAVGGESPVYGSGPVPASKAEAVARFAARQVFVASRRCLLRGVEVVTEHSAECPF